MGMKKLNKYLKNYFRDLLFKLCKKYGLEEEIFIEKYNNKFPRVRAIQQTIKELTTTNKSIIRFGDGELELIKGNDIPFQKSSPELQDRLKEVLSSQDDNILIGVPHFIYSDKDNLQDIFRNFWRLNGEKFRDTIANYIDAYNVYWASEFTIVFSAYKNFNVSGYFSDLKKIWDNKDLTLICGETVFDKIEYNIFANAKSVTYLYAPSLNAFDKYDEILNSALSIDRHRLVVVILGPTAKVLSYDLAKKGYRVLDLGHIAKSYDWYCKGRRTDQVADAVEFFNPD